MPRKRIAEYLIRRVVFSFEGKAWPLIFTHWALLICQDLTGEDMLSVQLRHPSATMLRALVYSALTSAGAECTLASVGKHIPFSRLKQVQKLVGSAWTASMPDLEPLAPVDPRRAKPKIELVVAKPATFDWVDAWAAGREQHKLSAEEWLEMTPRQFKALQKLRLEDMQRLELMNGILAATIQNFAACHPDKAAAPESFMLHPFPEKELPLVTGEIIMAALQRARSGK